MRSDANTQRRDLRRLAGFLADIRLADLPGEVVEQAVLAVLDGLGCGVGGAGDPALNALRDTVADLGEDGPCPALAGLGSFTPRTAALVNGAMIHGLEMDDTHSFSSVHAAGPVLSAALSAAFVHGCTGARFLEAVVAGYETACRLGVALRGPGPYHRGFHPTGVCGVFGACVAAARIGGLDAAGLVGALGIAGSMAAGLMSYIQNGAWTKKLCPGWAAQSGLMAAELAANGFTGPDNIFQGRYNFSAAYSDAFDPEALYADLGGRFEVARMSYKPFACCRSVHPEITAALALRAEPGFDPAAVEALHVVIADEDLALVVEPLQDKKRPATVVDAQFSMPFGLALALVRGKAMPSDFQAGLDDPEVLRLASLVSYEISDEFTAMRPLRYPCEVRAMLGGTRRKARVEAPVGDFTNPMSRAMFLDKFNQLAEPVLGAQRAGALRSLVEGLPEAASMDPFFALMRER